MIPESARLCFNFRLRKRGKGGEVVKVGIVLPLLLIFKINLSVTKMNIEKLPGRGGARGSMQNSNESARLRFHCCLRNLGKGGEVQPKWVLFFHYYLYLKRMAESEIVPKRHVFISILSR